MDVLATFMDEISKIAQGMGQAAPGAVGRTMSPKAPSMPSLTPRMGASAGASPPMSGANPTGMLPATGAGTALPMMAPPLPPPAPPASVPPPRQAGTTMGAGARAMGRR